MGRHLLSEWAWKLVLVEGGVVMDPEAVILRYGWVRQDLGQISPSPWAYLFSHEIWADVRVLVMVVLVLQPPDFRNRVLTVARSGQISVLSVPHDMYGWVKLLLRSKGRRT